MANRAQRRQMEREQMREWRKTGTLERALRIQQNGITASDLDKAFKNGYDEGYMFAAEGFMKKMYAAIAKELHEAGNSTDEVVSFLKEIDHRFAVMFDADEEIEDVYNLIGVRFNIDKNEINRIEEVAQ